MGMAGEGGKTADGEIYSPGEREKIKGEAGKRLIACLGCMFVCTE